MIDAALKTASTATSKMTKGQAAKVNAAIKFYGKRGDSNGYKNQGLYPLNDPNERNHGLSTPAMRAWNEMVNGTWEGVTPWQQNVQSASVAGLLLQA